MCSAFRPTPFDLLQYDRPRTVQSNTKDVKSGLTPTKITDLRSDSSPAVLGSGYHINGLGNGLGEDRAYGCRERRRKRDEQGTELEWRANMRADAGSTSNL